MSAFHTKQRKLPEMVLLQVVIHREVFAMLELVRRRRGTLHAAVVEEAIARLYAAEVAARR
jgi:hypothetical protein